MLSGRPLVTVVVGLVLTASLAVLAMLLFGPFPPVPKDWVSQKIRAVVTRPAESAKARQTHAAAKPVSHQLAQPADPAPAPREFPFEEHLAPREPGTPSSSSMRAKVEPPPAAVPTVTAPAVAGTEPGPVPGDSGKGPRMVVIIDDMGDHVVLAKNLTELPFPVTFAILPSRPHTRSIEAMAVDHGTEVILHQPMQPSSYPRVNPGPGAVFTDMDAQRIQGIVAANLAQVPHVIGINNHMGSAFTSDAPGMAAVMPVLRARGLFFMDSVTSASSAAAEAAHKAGVHYYRRSVFLDNVRNTRAILGQLKAAERHALKTGRAIAIGHPYGETLDALRLWAKERDNRIRIVTLKDLGPEF